MIINKKQMDEINAVQYDIFKEFHNVCEKLGLKYYLVHGSLLGALRHKGFFPMDDDIDVAMPRKDYEVFIRQGQAVIKKNFFIQSYLSEKEYPLVFSKVRADGTAFIQPVLQNCNVNQGIYIDVFPIDNYPTNKYSLKWLRIKGWIYGLRTSERLSFQKDDSITIRLITLLSKVLQPSWRHARNKYCELYNRVPDTGMVIVRGGKTKEVGIPFSLFGAPSHIQFETINSYAPNNIDTYLNLIYGDYMNYEPMGKDMVSDNEVNISAEIVDVNKSYKEYFKK